MNKARKAIGWNSFHPPHIHSRQPFLQQEEEAASQQTVSLHQWLQPLESGRYVPVQTFQTHSAKRMTIKILLKEEKKKRKRREKIDDLSYSLDMRTRFLCIWNTCYQLRIKRREADTISRFSFEQQGTDQRKRERKQKRNVHLFIHLILILVT